MTPRRPVQLGMFAGYEPVPEMHVVAAHTRLLSDGSEVFVSEHLRWNRGKTGPRVRQVERATPSDEPLEGQLGLFGASAR